MNSTEAHPNTLASGTLINIETAMPLVCPVQLRPLATGNSRWSNHWDVTAPTRGMTSGNYPFPMVKAVPMVMATFSGVLPGNSIAMVNIIGKNIHWTNPKVTMDT